MIVCSRCAKDNQDHYKFCLGCGAELPRESSKPRSFSAPSPSSGSSSGGTGTKPPQRMQAAEAVAAEHLVPEPEPDPSPMQPVVQAVTEADALPPELSPLAEDTSPCSNCGASVPENFRFCHVCGHDLHAAPAQNGAADAPAERVSEPAVAAAPDPRGAAARLVL
ncbi:MAG: zinc-ribbon domain-containing protein, partial [Polyangiales bacterium]